MTTIKSYTDISQSKKLAEFLPLESADMFYNGVQDLDKEMAFNIPIDGRTITVRTGHIITEKGIKANLLLPCWSLAALLNILPIVYTNNKKEVCGPLHIDITDSETPFVLWYVNPLHKGNIVEIQTKEYDNMIDACVEMVLKLHKQKLI